MDHFEWICGMLRLAARENTISPSPSNYNRWYERYRSAISIASNQEEVEEVIYKLLCPSQILKNRAIRKMYYFSKQKPKTLSA
jgi:hypothetical protein